MQKLKTEWRDFMAEFGWKALLDSFLGGFVYATLMMIPIFLILAELITVFMYLKDLLFFLVTIAAMGYVILIDVFAYRALQLKKPDHGSNPGWLLRIHATFCAAIALLTGLIFIFILIPILWV